MSLQDCIIKRSYYSLKDNIARDFYIPLLNEAVLYQRAVGYFTSSILVKISEGICNFAKNGGKIQLIASPELNEDDILAINKGYELRQVIKNRLFENLIDLNDLNSQERLNLISILIANEQLDIKIACTKGLGIYHEKVGIISDSNGNRIAFTGSLNETGAAISLNYESFDVFTNWRNEEDKIRVETKVQDFERKWQNNEDSLFVFDFPEVKEEIIRKYKRKKEPDYTLDCEFTLDNLIPKYEVEEINYIAAEPNLNIPKRPEEYQKLYDYQEKAINEWVLCGYCGIFDMATGTGKTLTGLGAITELSNDLDNKVAVFIVAPYQHLVEQWVEDIVRFNIKPIIGYSSSPQKDWKKRLTNAIRDQKIRDDKSFFCFVCTNTTFKNKFLQEQIDKIKAPILLVVDEAHNFGAASYAQLLDDRFTYRLALSATLERHHDEEGTEMLYNFFGKKCIEYPLERAIEEGKLTPYKYYPVVVHLNKDELGKYEQLSYEMSKCIIKDKMGKNKLNKHGEMLALERARIVAGAGEKLDALREQIQPYIHDNNILVYCGATNVLDEHSDSSLFDDGDIRQIEAVCNILGNEMGMDVAQFTSNENMETRALIKEQFQRGDRLQAIVAIKCLDEGVNIPGIKTAFILASTTNPKEYIQRRGRVLRKAQGKAYAVIYDFVTLPRPLDSVASLTIEQAQRDLTLVKNELGRLKEFGRLSQNSMDANNLIWDIQEAYHISDESEEEEYEYGGN